MIETNRLILRNWRESDAGALYKYASDKRVSELALWPCHTSVRMSHEVIRRVFMTNRYSFAIVLKESTEPIGCIGIVPQGSEHCALACSEREIGYWIGYPYWNRGLASEALEALIGYCRVSMNIESLVITTDRRNAASRRVAEKCGFSFLGNYDFQGMDMNAYRLCL